MAPFALILIGLCLGAVGVVLLRTIGPGFRVGRLLATTPAVSVADALAAATAGPRYVRIAGRVDAAEPFEDDAHRPLVFRRTRLQVRDGRRWRATEDDRRTVAFEVREGLDAIAIDGAALDEGLVVMPRESVGVAADAPDRVPPGTAPDAPVRLLVEQLSSVEHVVALGVPSVGPDGMIRLTAGMGRPLVLSSLATDEAMRVLAGGDPRRPRLAAAALAGAGIAIVAGAAWLLVEAVT